MTVKDLIKKLQLIDNNHQGAEIEIKLDADDYYIKSVDDKPSFDPNEFRLNAIFYINI